MKPTPAVASQTVGPYFAIGLNLLITPDIAAPGVAGERFTLKGRVFDANRKPIPDAMIEVWQADAAGQYPHEAVGTISPWTLRFEDSDAWPQM